MTGDLRVVLMGDLVRSRQAADRVALHQTLEGVLRAPRDPGPEIPFVLEAGDEFKSEFLTLGAALRASFQIRAELHRHTDVRFGVGRGRTFTLDPVRGAQDGPAYWAARDAITRAKDRAERPQTRTSRTAYVAPDEPAAEVAMVGAALDCLDFMVGSMSTTSREILGGLMHGLAQRDVADRLAITPSAVSQRIRRDGIGVALEAMATLGGLP